MLGSKSSTQTIYIRYIYQFGVFTVLVLSYKTKAELIVCKWNRSGYLVDNFPTKSADSLKCQHVLAFCDVCWHAVQ